MSLDQFATTGEADTARALVRRILDSGYLVSVNDGKRWKLKLSADFDEITGALCTTSQDTLRVSRKDIDGTPYSLGVINMIYGNAEDGSGLIADCSSRSEILQLLPADNQSC